MAHTIKNRSRRASRQTSDAPNGVYAFPTDFGWMAIDWTGASLRGFTLGHPSAVAAIAACRRDCDVPVTADPPAQVARLAERIQAYAAGAEDDFRDVPLDLGHLTEFQRRVVQACRRIRPGQTLTYGELAARAGSPGAARAVGNTMARNRFPIVIPCHRVVGSAGSLGGFSAPAGVSLKQRLLELEGARAERRTKPR